MWRVPEDNRNLRNQARKDEEDTKRRARINQESEIESVNEWKRSRGDFGEREYKEVDKHQSKVPASSKKAQIFCRSSLDYAWATEWLGRAVQGLF